MDRDTRSTTKPLPHRYDVRLTGGPAGHATLSAADVPDLRSASPLEFGGPGDAWSPSTPVRLEPEIVGARP
jgi:hypothetical protein